MYDAASKKTAFFYQPLHDPVIRMRINPQIAGPLQTKREASLKYAPFCSVTCHTVDRPIGPIVYPHSVFNDTVGGFLSDKENKRTAEPPIYLNNK